jgi:hypothetical protein
VTEDAGWTSFRLESIRLVQRLGAFILVAIGSSQVVVQWVTIGWVAGVAYGLFYFVLCGWCLGRILWRIYDVALEDERRRLELERVEVMEARRLELEHKERERVEQERLLGDVLRAREEIEGGEQS